MGTYGYDHGYLKSGAGEAPSKFPNLKGLAKRLRMLGVAASKSQANKPLSFSRDVMGKGHLLGY